MKRYVIYLCIVFIALFSSMTFAATTYSDRFYALNSYTHWAVPYVDNLEQRLQTVKQTISDDNDFSSKDIETVIQKVFDRQTLDEPIQSSVWQKMLMIFLDTKETESELIKNESGQSQITREDAVVGMMKILQEKSILQSSQTNAAVLNEKFYDSRGLEEEKAALISVAVSEGIISGYDDSSLRPKQYLRNSEAVTIIEKVCSKYGLPTTQWNSNIRILRENGYIKVEGPQDIEEAFWTNDNGILMVYNTREFNEREAAKVFIDQDEAVKALEYEKDNLSEGLLNQNAFNRERGYISANKVVWNKNRRYINSQGQLKSIHIPYLNYWISQDDKMVLMQDEEKRMVNIYDFINEKNFTIDDYFRWADDKYQRAVKWAPDSAHIISLLFKPDDDIGIGEKERFAVFNCYNGKLEKVIHERGYYSFYPTWSPDGKKIAFYRVKTDDKELEFVLNNMVDRHFNLPVTEIGIYDLESGQIHYYTHPESVILGKHSDGIVWSPEGDKVYIETAVDKEKFLKDLREDINLNFDHIPNAIWELDIEQEEYTKILSGEYKVIKEEPSEEELLSLNEIFAIPEDTEVGSTGEETALGGGFVQQPISDEPLVEEIPYAVTNRICSISKNGDRILYVKQTYNLSRYENIPPDYVILDLNTGEQITLEEKMLTDYWWLSDGRLVYVENKTLGYRQAKITYHIQQVNHDLDIQHIISFSQYPTSVSISPDERYLMLYQYRGEKDVKIIKLFQ